MPRTGRPTDYNAEFGMKICNMVAEGSNINRIVKIEGMPIRNTIYTWFKKHPDFKDNYLQARKERAEFRFDKIDSIMEDMRAGIIDAAMAKVELDAIKWQSGKEDSNIYGDKHHLEHSGTMTLGQLVMDSYNGK